MPNNQVLKTIKIDVDSSQYKALQKSLEAMYKLEREIYQLKTKSDDEMKKEVKEREDALKVAIAEKKLNEDQIKSEQKKIDLLKAGNNLIKVRRKLLEQEREIRYQEQKESIKQAAQQRQAELNRKYLEQGKPTFLQTFSKYKGISGRFSALSDITARKGELKVAAIDEEIAQKQDTQKLNQAEIEKLQRELKDPSKQLSKNQIKWRQNRINKLISSNKSIDTDIEGLKDKKAITIGDTQTALNKIESMGKVATAVSKALAKLGKAALHIVLKPFKQLASGISDVIRQMIDLRSGIATYNMSNSLITNTSAREQQMKYGLSTAQNYAFTQTRSMLNIQSDEDLMYMNAEQREKFLTYMQRYSAWYDKMEASGVLARIQEMQLEFGELKQQLAMDFLSWVAENKETIMNCIKGIFEIVKRIAEFVMKIINLFTGNRYRANSLSDISDIGTSSNTNNKVTNININANTTNNATGVLGSREALDKFSKENWNNLAKQLVTAVGG